MRPIAPGIAVQRAPAHRPPSWPVRECRCTSTFASTTSMREKVPWWPRAPTVFRAAATSFRVFADPASHPFCLVLTAGG